MTSSQEIKKRFIKMRGKVYGKEGKEKEYAKIFQLPIVVTGLTTLHVSLATMKTADEGSE